MAEGKAAVKRKCHAVAKEPPASGSASQWLKAWRSANRLTDSSQRQPWPPARFFISRECLWSDWAAIHRPFGSSRPLAVCGGALRAPAPASDFFLGFAPWVRTRVRTCGCALGVRTSVSALWVRTSGSHPEVPTGGSHLGISCAPRLSARSLQSPSSASATCRMDLEEHPPAPLGSRNWSHRVASGAGAVLPSYLRRRSP